MSVATAPTANERRLPSRKRPRREFESSANAEEAVESPANDDPRTAESGTGGVLPLLIMPELIAELVENGSVAPHVKRLLLSGHRSSWRDRRSVAPEIEFGSSVATVEPDSAGDAAAVTTGPRATAAAVPLLLRAFRRAPASAARGSAAAPVVHHHCLAGPQPVDDWAPMSLVHVAKALRSSGLTLAGPRVCFQPTETTNASVGGQRYTVSRRWQHTLGPTLRDRTAVTNHKAKYQVPVNYPGQVTESMHLALEHTEPAPPGGEPFALSDAQHRGVLSVRLCGSPTGGSAAVTHSAYVKCEWESPIADNPLLRVVAQLHFVVAAGTDADAFHTAVLAAPRPKNPADVPRWLAAVGCRGSAEWRVEVEMVPPVQPAAITQGLFLHHLIRQTVRPTGACLPRPTFIALYHRHCRGARDAADAVYARGLLREYCDALGLPPNPRRGDGHYYPLQPRPYDLVARYLDRLLRCVATPKADGLEAFLIGHAHGAALLLRTGRVHCYPWRRDDARVFPFVLEGEVFGPAAELFVAYDCPQSPAARYGADGRYATRHAAAEALVRRLDGSLRDGPAVRCKPCFPVATHPHAAIRRCAEWAREVGLPCDGVVFVDDGQPGYVRGDRLWKLKDAPTIDFAVFRAPANAPEFAGLYELMLRGARGGALQSVHRFRHAAAEFIAPVLLRPPPGVSLRDGQVVELTVRTGPPPPTPPTTTAGDEAQEEARPSPVAAARVSFPTLLCRETGKAPNFVTGGMDLMANGVSAEAFLRADSPVLPRLIVKGPLRRARDDFVRATLRSTGARAVLEIGGGRGGDCNLWAAAESVRTVDVVEPDAAAVTEYRRRLRTAHRAADAGDGRASVLPDGRVFRFHTVPLFDLDPAVGRGCDLAVLNFSVSQVVSGWTDLDSLLCGVLGRGRGIPWMIVAAHDHVFAGLSVADGVVCRRVHPTGCTRHRLFCTCDGILGRSAAVLSTTVAGTLMANGIREYAFGAVYLERAVRRLRAAGRLPPATAVRVFRPFGSGTADDVHWLLRSLVMVTVKAAGETPTTQTEPGM